MKKTVIFAVLALLLLGAGFLAHRALVSPPEEEPVALYFTRLGAPEASVFEVYRPAPDHQGDPAGRIRAALEMLLLGPLPEEAGEGYLTELPPGITVKGVRLEGDVAFVDFSPEIAAGGGTASMRARLMQVVYTVTRFGRVNRVRFLIDGEMIDYFSGEGLTEVESPLGRADFPMEAK